jgi:hypothetical protein
MAGCAHGGAVAQPEQSIKAANIAASLTRALFQHGHMKPPLTIQQPAQQAEYPRHPGLDRSVGFLIIRDCKLCVLTFLSSLGHTVTGTSEHTNLSKRIEKAIRTLSHCAPYVVDDVISVSIAVGVTFLGDEQRPRINTATCKLIDNKVCAKLRTLRSGTKHRQPAIPSAVQTGTQLVLHSQNSVDGIVRGDSSISFTDYSQSDSQVSHASQDHHSLAVSSPAGTMSSSASSQLFNKYQTSKKTCNRLKRKCAALTQIVSSLKTEMIECKFTYKSKRRTTGAQKENITVKGGYRLALLRNVGHTSTAACAAMLQHVTLSKLHRHSVTNWEKQLAAAIQTTVSVWYKLQQAHVKRSANDDTSFTFEVHTMMGDGTNGSTLHNHKLHTCNVISHYNYDYACSPSGPAESPADQERPASLGPDDSDHRPANRHNDTGYSDMPDLLDEDVDDYLCVSPLCHLPSTHSSFADTQFVPGLSNGVAMHHLYTKHLQSVGAPHWITSGADSADGSETQSDNDNLHIRVYLHVADMGPDEVSCSKLVARDVDGDDKTLFLRGACFQHQGHLIVKRQLKRLSSHFDLKLICFLFVNTYLNMWC